MKLNEIAQPATLQAMVELLKKHFDDVAIDGDGVSFTNRTNAKAPVRARLVKGKWDVIVSGNKGDILVERGCKADEVIKLAKSFNNAWFKEYDPDNDD